MPNLKSLKDDYLKRLVAIYQYEGVESAVSQLGLSEETINRYLREARKRGIIAMDKTKLMSQIAQSYTDKELEAIAKGGRIVPGYGKVPVISFEGQNPYRRFYRHSSREC